VQTSTVTVAVLDPDAPAAATVRPADVDITTTRGSGPGGQKRNKTETCVIATHRPTGVTVRVDNERSQHDNRRLAMQLLGARVAAAAHEAHTTRLNANRAEQVGSGERGDKIRTYRVRDDQVTDHRTGRKWRLAVWMRGEWA
jgi:peptide chain release factor 1